MISTTQILTLPSGAPTTLEQWGTSGPAILVVHGIGSSRRDAQRLGEALTESHRIFAYDQRGHGDSAGATASMDLPTLANDLKYVAQSIDNLKLVIGHSWGGAVTLKAAPDAGPRLLLIDPLLRVPIGSFHEYVDDLREILDLPIGEKRDAAIRAAFEGAHSLDIAAKVHAMHRLDINDIQRLGDENATEQGGWDLRPELANVNIPVTILRADIESVLSDADLQNASSSVSLQVIKNHGHTLHRTDFGQYVTMVLASLAAS
jgi:pimeloyl-ACP methyl ester carboxylesterase